MSAVDDLGRGPRDWFPHPDAGLQVLVSVLNQNPLFAIDLTLTVGGSLVTGTAVGAATYWTILAERDEQGPKTGLVDFYKDSAQMASEAARESAGSSDVTFVHLIDCAHWISSDACVPSDQRAMWRGRLSQVQGWTIGRIGPRPQPDSTTLHADSIRRLQAETDETDPVKTEGAERR